MTLHPVVSANILAVGYHRSNRTLRIQFRSGGTYDYFGVDPGLFEQMLLPHPWRRLGRLVKVHPYTKVA